jgi:hypothetical protein
MRRVQRSLREKPKGSNLIERLLSVENLRTDKTFLILSGTIRTLLSANGQEERGRVV